MAVELRPLGVRCNLACLYCYQASARSSVQGMPAYDLDAMIRTAAGFGRSILLFGGEPLLLPLPDLERLLAFSYERYGGSGIQSNGVLLSDVHVRLCKRYNVHVGISIDGPGRLNELRWAHSPSETASATQKTIAAIGSLCSAGLFPSLIITLHRVNALAGRLEELLQWVSELEQQGVPQVRLHLLEAETQEIRRRFGLTVSEATNALLAFHGLEKRLSGLKFDIFTDMRRGLDPESSGPETCVWNACDPYTTPAVSGVEGDGTLSNCGRTNKEGIEFLKANGTSYERALVLHHTPAEYGGCKGCRFFLACQGQCPGTAIDGDWRNRSEHCGTWFAIFEVLEKESVAAGSVPLSLRPERTAMEEAALIAWLSGRSARAVIYRCQVGLDAPT